MANKYPVGFWNYVLSDDQGPDQVKNWAEMGVTLTMSAEYDPATSSKENMLAVLDECQKYGIKMLICDSRTRWGGAATDEEGYRARVQAAYDDFGKHPATHGFFVGDEPYTAEMLADCMAAMRIQKEVAPELVAFLNFNPYPISDMMGGQPYGEWCREFTKSTGCKQICYDYYAQLSPRDDGIDGYFRNLRSYYKIAEEAGIELWNTVLSIGHFDYRCPTIDDFRWQVYTTLAAGCKGIIWFYVYSQHYRNYRRGPFNHYGEKTETYYWLSEIMRDFHNDFGELFMGLTLKESLHVGKCFGGYKPFVKNVHPLIRRVNTRRQLPAIISYFEDAEGKEYVALVNNSQTESDLFTLSLPKGTKVYNVRKNGAIMDDMKDHHHDAFYDRDR